jgi:hypothetical protein
LLKIVDHLERSEEPIKQAESQIVALSIVCFGDSIDLYKAFIQNKLTLTTDLAGNKLVDQLSFY